MDIFLENANIDIYKHNIDDCKQTLQFESIELQNFMQDIRGKIHKNILQFPIRKRIHVMYHKKRYKVEQVLIILPSITPLGEKRYPIQFTLICKHDTSYLYLISYGEEGNEITGVNTFLKHVTDNISKGTKQFHIKNVSWSPYVFLPKEQSFHSYSIHRYHYVLFTDAVFQIQPDYIEHLKNVLFLDESQYKTYLHKKAEDFHALNVCVQEKEPLKKEKEIYVFQEPPKQTHSSFRNMTVYMILNFLLLGFQFAYIIAHSYFTYTSIIPFLLGSLFTYIFILVFNIIQNVTSSNMILISYQTVVYFLSYFLLWYCLENKKDYVFLMSILFVFVGIIMYTLTDYPSHVNNRMYLMVGGYAITYGFIFVLLSLIK